jgi:hypothetical protein
LRILGRIDGSYQDNRTVDCPSSDRSRRHHGTQRLLKFPNVNFNTIGRNVRADIEVQIGYLSAELIQGKNACFASIHANDIELARRPDHRVGYLWVGNENFRRILGKTKDAGLTNGHRNAPRRNGVGAHGVPSLLCNERANGRDDREGCHQSQGEARD